jgi:hypothetical protein
MSPKMSRSSGFLRTEVVRQRRFHPLILEDEEHEGPVVAHGKAGDAEAGSGVADINVLVPVGIVRAVERGDVETNRLFKAGLIAPDKAADIGMQAVGANHNIEFTRAAAV